MTLKSVLRTLLPRYVRAHRILYGPLRGHRIVTSWHDYPAAILGRTEASLLKWFEANVHPGETWLDIGAHYGYTALALCKLVGTSGRVFAFEPVLATAGYLAATQQANSLRQLAIVPFALGGDNALSLTSTSVDRGMATHHVTNGATAALYTIGLDRLWPSINGDKPRIDGIKVDVQGMECETIAGMVGLMQRWRPKLIVEVHEAVDRTRLLTQLAQAGYPPTAHPIESTDIDRRELLDNHSYLFVPATTP